MFLTPGQMQATLRLQLERLRRPFGGLAPAAAPPPRRPRPRGGPRGGGAHAAIAPATVRPQSIIRSPGAGRRPRRGGRAPPGHGPRRFFAPRWAPESGSRLSSSPKATSRFVVPERRRRRRVCAGAALFGIPAPPRATLRGPRAAALPCPGPPRAAPRRPARCPPGPPLAASRRPTLPPPPHRPAPLRPAAPCLAPPRPAPPRPAPQAAPRFVPSGFGCSCVLPPSRCRPSPPRPFENHNRHSPRLVGTIPCNCIGPSAFRIAWRS